jgi:hypothetical protein
VLDAARLVPGRGREGGLKGAEALEGLAGRLIHPDAVADEFHLNFFS